MRAKAPDVREGHARTAAPDSAKPPAAVTVTTTTDDAPAPTPPPPPPEHLGPEAVALWHELWEDGAEAYRPTDRHAVERYCSLQERRLRLLRVLDVDGYTSMGSQGQVVAHPAARLVSDIETKLTPLEDRLGLNPDARIRLGLGAQQLRRNALDTFMDRPEDDIEDVS